MGFAYPVYGNVVEVGTNEYTTVTIDTTPTALGIVTFTVPTVSEIGGKIIGCYVDFYPRAIENTFAGANYIVQTSTCYARITSPPCRVINYMDSMFYCSGLGEFNGKRYYGNVNCISSIVQGSTYNLQFIAAETVQDSIILKDMQAIVRYVVV